MLSTIRTAIEMGHAQRGRWWRRAIVLWALCVSNVGCSFFAPNTETAAQRARKIEPKCGGSTDKSVATLLLPNAVDSVEPTYSYVNGGPNGREAHLRGARIHLRPLAGLSRELVARSLECHEALATLGRVTTQSDDPYVLPGRWLTIDVDSEGDGFVILVRPYDREDARRVVERARRFVGTRDGS